MTTLREAAEKALKALEVATTPRSEDRQTVLKAQAALREALAQPDPNPFGYFQYSMQLDAWVQNKNERKGVAFYTHPPQRKPLTVEQLRDIKEHQRLLEELGPVWAPMLYYFCQAIERAHGIGGEE